MTLQTSGAISLSQVQSEYGGSNPISMSEYYRGGSYVPSSNVGSYSSYQANASTYYWADVGNSGTVTIEWNNSVVANFTSSATTYITGGYEYQKGTLFSSSSGGKGGPTTYYYRVRRRTNSGSINTNVPTSGSISMNDFYGGVG